MNLQSQGWADYDQIQLVARIDEGVGNDRPGFTRVGRSYNQILICDEMTRRLQEMGRIPPGLPGSDAYEPTQFRQGTVD
jgi:hypothetical protein